MKISNSPKNNRLSIPVSKKAHEVFSVISNASGVSLGKCIASWLDDTLDAADFMAQKIVQARQTPRILSQELNGYAAGLSVALDTVIDNAKRGKGGLTPPSSNTGGKGTEQARKSKISKGGN